MFDWLEKIGVHFTNWLGSGFASFFKWLFGGLTEIVTKVIDAAGGIWDLLDSILGLLFGFKDLIYDLLLVYFPFIPAPVSAVIAMGLMAGVILGVVKLLRKVFG